MPMHYDLSIVIPIYKSADSINALVNGLENINSLYNIEYIFVVDGSPDKSYEILFSELTHSVIARSSTIVRHSKNFGEHQAVLTGYRYASADYIVNIDDDLQNSPFDALRLYEYAQQGTSDVVYAKYPVKYHQTWRNYGSLLANMLLNRLLRRDNYFYFSSFRCLNSFVAREISRYCGPYPHIDSLLAQVTTQIYSLEVSHYPRLYGESTYTLGKLVDVLLNSFMTLSIAPLRLSSVIGTFMFLFGSFISIILLFQSIFHGVDIPGWTSLIIVMLIFGSVQMLLLGILGEYVGRTFMTVAVKPQSIVRDVVIISHETQSSSLPRI